jgi:hypothetical protein
MEIKIVRDSYSWWDSGFVLLSQMHQSIYSGTNGSSTMASSIILYSRRFLKMLDFPSQSCVV